MITTSTVLAYKIERNQIVLLSRVGTGYFLTFGNLKNDGSNDRFTDTTATGIENLNFSVIFKKEIHERVAYSIYIQLQNTANTADKNNNCKLLAGEIIESTETANPYTEVLFLGQSKTDKTNETPVKTSGPIPSPYFKTRDIFLATQMTCAPNLRG
jgi:hypothetical protein